MVLTLRPRGNTRFPCPVCGRLVTSGSITDHVRRHHQLSMAQLRAAYGIPRQSHNEELVMAKARAACRGRTAWNRKYENKTTAVVCCICGDSREMPTHQLEGYRKKGLTRFSCGSPGCANKLRAIRVKEVRSTPESKARTSAASKKMWSTGDRQSHIQALAAGTHSYNTGPERVVQGFLRESRVAFSTHNSIKLPAIGSHCLPDVTIGTVLVFVDGCLWHNCPVCDHRAPPGFVHGKDDIVSEQLEAIGYTVIRIWEHELKGEAWKSRLLEALK